MSIFKAGLKIQDTFLTWTSIILTRVAEHLFVLRRVISNRRGMTHKASNLLNILFCFNHQHIFTTSNINWTTYVKMHLDYVLRKPFFASRRHVSLPHTVSDKSVTVYILQFIGLICICNHSAQITVEDTWAKFGNFHQKPQYVLQYQY